MLSPLQELSGAESCCLFPERYRRLIEQLHDPQQPSSTRADESPMVGMVAAEANMGESAAGAG